MKYGKYIKKSYPAVAKRARVYVPAVRQLASDVMYLKGLVNSEPKSFTVNTSANTGQSGVVFSLCDLAQGDGAADRDGNRVLPRYLSLYIHVNQIAASAGWNHTTHRVIVFRYWGEDSNVAGPSVTTADILETTASQYSPVSHLRSTITGSRGDRNRRIEVLRNEFFTLDLNTEAQKAIHYNIEMNGKGSKTKEHIEFRNNTTEQPTSGGIYVLYVNDNATSTDQGIWVGSRLTFYDN